MDKNEHKILARLKNLSETPDFSSFFAKFVKHSPLQLKKGSILFYDDQLLDKLYFIKKGFVHLYKLSEEGKETTSYLFGPGYVLGIRALTSSDKKAKHTAQALSDIEVVAISHKEYLEAVSKNPQYLTDLIYLFIDRLNYTERKLEGFIATDVTTRVAYFLFSCVKRFSKKEIKENIVLPFELTHQLISEFVGSFRETVSVAIEKLEKNGVLKTHRGIVTILDLEKLKYFANLHKKP